MASNNSDTNNVNDIVVDAQPESPNDQSVHNDEDPARNQQQANVISQSDTSHGNNTEEQLKFHLPANLKDDYWIHLLIIHSEDDLEDATALKESLVKNVKICGGLTPNVALLAEVITDFTFHHLKEAFLRSTCILIYATENLAADNKKLLESHSCLLKALESHEEKKAIIPVHTCPENNRNYELPMMLDNLQPLFDFTVTFIKKVTDILNNKSAMILKRKESLEKEQKEFLKQIRERKGL